ncbi:transcriptional activator RinB [Staphylococcus aureus]|nr:transcriptional activator RinB [Staphylococcus aureus]MBV2878687.1 transcriptional activator RinB [Staphylococcus aureus]
MNNIYSHRICPIKCRRFNVTEQVYIMMTANDDVEAPSDFAKLSDQSDLMRAEVSE